MASRFVQFTLGFVLALGLTSQTFAQSTAAPNGAVLLTISGEVPLGNSKDTLVLDRAALVAMPATTVETSTIWTDGVHTFTGVSLYSLAQELGIQGVGFRATAINDYAVEIPASDIVEGGPIIAYLMDGNEMSVRDKGPLWVVYPYDSRPEYRTEVIYSRSIWQLDRLETMR